MHAYAHRTSFKIWNTTRICTLYENKRKRIYFISSISLCARTYSFIFAAGILGGAWHDRLGRTSLLDILRDKCTNFPFVRCTNYLSSNKVKPMSYIYFDCIVSGPAAVHIVHKFLYSSVAIQSLWVQLCTPSISKQNSFD